MHVHAEKAAQKARSFHADVGNHLQDCCAKILSALLYSRSSMICNALLFSYIPCVLRRQTCHAAAKYQISKDLTAMWTLQHVQAHITLALFCSLRCCLHMHVITFTETDGVRTTIYFDKHKIFRQMYFLTGDNCLSWVIAKNFSTRATANLHTTMVTSVASSA